MIEIILSPKLGELRMSQAELARITSIRPTTISELTMRSLKGSTWSILICEALDCDISEIMVWVPNKEPKITHDRAGRLKAK